MAKIKGYVQIVEEKCKGCELCIAACPTKSLHLADTINAQGFRFAVMINADCTGCTSCSLVCPEAIIKVYRKRIEG